MISRRLACALRATFALTLCAALAANLASPLRASGRSLRVGLVQQPNSLDPLHATQFYENYLSEALFSALVVLDDKEQPAPDLAEVVPTRANGGISADGKSITYHLRRGVRWQDGVPLTSHDVAFTFAAMRDDRSAFTESTVYSIIDRVDTPDDRTVVVRLRRPWADATIELFVGGQNGSILPQHAFKSTAVVPGGAFEAAPVGSGPYVLERWDRGSELVLRASPTYFRGKPAIDRIDVKFVPDVNTLAIQLRTGEIDFTPQLTARSALQIEHLPHLQSKSALTFTAYELGFNLKLSPFDDVRVRRALALGIDRVRIAADVLHGRAVVADDLVPPVSEFHTVDPQRPARGDFAKAGALLDAAGWKLGSDRLRHKSGATLSVPFTFAAGNDDIAGAAVQIQADWSKLGVSAELRPVLSNQLYGATEGLLARGSFSVYLNDDGFATGADRVDRLGTKAIPPLGLNYPRFSDRRFDELSERARTTSDLAARKSIYATISALVRDRAPIEPLLWTEHSYVYSDALSGVRPETVNSDFWNVWEWRLK